MVHSGSLSNEAKLEKLIETATPEVLMAIYGISKFSTLDELLLLLAKKYGKLKQGGLPMLESAQSILLKDWESGKIPYCSQVPLSVAKQEDSKLVGQLSEEMVLH